jgi:hypothetical protein
MGISKITASLFKDSINERIFFGNILQLGKQDIYIDRNIYNKIFKRTDSGKDKIDTDEFFLNLGFSSVSSLDASGFEGADYICDLNHKSSDSLEQKFDCIFDGGTLEHIFNLPQALENIDKMLKIGGHVIHNLPSHNHVDHGFYMFSPGTLWDYYLANGYEIVKFYIYEYSVSPSRLKAFVYEYQPGEIDHLSVGGWGKMPISIWMIAKKTSRASNYIMPQQGYYQKIWKKIPDTSNKTLATSKSAKLIKNSIKKNRTIYKALVNFHAIILNYLDRRPKCKFKID